MALQLINLLIDRLQLMSLGVSGVYLLACAAVSPAGAAKAGFLGDHTHHWAIGPQSA